MAATRSAREIAKDILDLACELYARENKISNARENLWAAELRLRKAEKEQQGNQAELLAASKHHDKMQAEFDDATGSYCEAYQRYYLNDAKYKYSEYEQDKIWDSSFPEFKSDEDREMYFMLDWNYELKYRGCYNAFIAYEQAVRELLTKILRNPQTGHNWRPSFIRFTIDNCAVGLYQEVLSSLYPKASSTPYPRDKTVEEFKAAMTKKINYIFRQDIIEQEKIKGDFKSNLISALKAYIARIEGYKNTKSGEIDFSHGFNLFSTSRALNRQANYELAKELLKKLESSGEVAIETLFDDAGNLRNSIIGKNIKNNPDYVERGINSSELNKILNSVKSYASNRDNIFKI